MMFKICMLSTIILLSESYQMTKCQLLRALRANRFPEAQMKDWMCLVEHESGRRTEKVGPLNHDGSRDYGLFQINDKYWCSNTSTPGKDCNVTCRDLLTDDIRKAARCTKKIFKRHGFRAWYGWRKHCRGEKPDLPDC